MDEIRLLLKTIRAVSKTNPVTYIQLSEIIRKLWRPRLKVYSVFQEAHGFEVGDVIKPADPLWVKAKADTEANAKATAVVCEIVDADNFIYLQEGLIPGEYEIGKTYFLSVTSSGAVFVQTNPEIWTVGQYRQMIGTGTADGLLVEIDEGSTIKQDTTPHIGENGNWYIGPTDTGIPATGPAGANGQNGANGADGVSPHIGVNGNWFIGANDTGIAAAGPAGANGQNGQNGADGVSPHIGVNGNWYIGAVDTGISATGPAGANGANGAAGRGIVSVELTSTVGLVKTYTITFTDATTTTFNVTDGAAGEGGGGGGTVTVITEGENIEVYYDFKDAIPFTYTCPMALRFLEVEHEGNAPALSVALNTDMAKYDDLVITPDGPGLVIVRGKVATAFDWPVYIDFDHAGEETYKCPYPLKFLVMEHEQANAPTLSVALNTNMAKYQVLTITTDAPGLVSLIGILL